MKVTDFKVEVRWSEGDNAFVALVPELEQLHIAIGGSGRTITEAVEELKESFIVMAKAILDADSLLWGYSIE